jgi:alpha/beta superfamily hydrolase
MGGTLHVDIAGPAGRLDALWEEPPSARTAAVVCHPHPLFGGTMHTHAVHRIARAARGAGVATLRFQFRGVGRSEGVHDGGRGEQDDVRAAVAWVRARRAAPALLLAGFSFGAQVSLAVASADPAISGLLAAGLPLQRDEEDLARKYPGPLASIQGERDEFATAAQVAEALAGSAGPRRLSAIRGASHLFTEDLGSLEHEAGAAFGWLLEVAS